MTETASQKVRKIKRGLLAIVYAAHERVFEGDSPPGLRDVAIDCRHQCRDGVAPIDRDQSRPQFIARCMQGDGQIELQGLCREGIDLRGRCRKSRR